MKDYKKILEGVVNIVNTTEKSDIGFANICTYIGENCPELAESEDERIRKELITHCRNTRCVTEEGAEMIANWLAWLEKQGEQNLCMIQWKGDNLKEVIDFTGKDKNFEKWFKSFEEYEKYVQEHDGIFKLFNADGSHYEVPVGAWIVKTPDGYNVASKAIFRQKSVDTPKFKVGDWVIVSTSDEEKVVQIDSIEYFKSGEPKYITSEGRWFGSGTKARLWTIQDANDGDVLYSPSHRLIWIYKDNERYHTSINLNYANVVSFDNEIVFPSDVCPANRVQKSILFQKMEEAGYEWDAEKKELKKIEQKSATMSLDEAIEHCKEKSCGNNACALEHKQLEKWLTELKELKEQNPAWSEEDEHIINKILCICNDFKRSFEISPASTKVVQNDIDKIDSWLESLRHRNTWKPSDEQMERLKGIINSLPHQEVLYSLYQDLLKLKG